MTKLLIIVTKWVRDEHRDYRPVAVSTSVVEFDDKKSLEDAVRELDAANSNMDDGSIGYVRL